MIEWNWIYLYGYFWLVTGGVLIIEISPRDLLISYLVALAWPVVLPSYLLRRVLYGVLK